MNLGLIDCLALDRPPPPPLSDCPCGDDPCRHVQTLRHGQSTIPWQADYFFVSERLKGCVLACDVVDRGIRSLGL
jgi:hypothetical protein